MSPHEQLRAMIANGSAAKVMEPWSRELCDEEIDRKWLVDYTLRVATQRVGRYSRRTSMAVWLCRLMRQLHTHTDSLEDLNNPRTPREPRWLEATAENADGADRELAVDVFMRMQLEGC